MSSSWSKDNLGDLCNKIGSGVTPRGGSSVYVSKGCSLIRSQNVYNLRFDYKGLVYINSKTALKMKGVELLPNDILLNITGDSVARCCMVPNELIPARVNQHVSIIRPKEELLNPKFLLYFMNLNSTKEQLLSYAGAGATRKALTKTMIESIVIKFPELKRQKVIANILSSLDDKIEINNKINKNLEELAQTLYKQWFVDFDFPNEEGEPYKTSGGEMIESELGFIPKRWKISHLGVDDFSNLIGSGIDAFEGTKKYIATADVTNSTITSFETEISYEDRPSRANMQPKINSLWFAKMKDSRKLIRVSKYSDYLIKKCIFSTGFAGLICNNSLNYIWSFLLTKDFDDIKNNLCNGTTMQAINNSNINKIKIIIPDKNILKNFEILTEDLFSKIESNEKENKKLSKLRDILLPKLMSGEIEVPIEDN